MCRSVYELVHQLIKWVQISCIDSVVCITYVGIGHINVIYVFGLKSLIRKMIIFFQHWEFKLTHHTSSLCRTFVFLTVSNQLRYNIYLKKTALLEIHSKQLPRNDYQ